jgi:hypothetical protein
MTDFAIRTDNLTRDFETVRAMDHLRRRFGSQAISGRRLIRSAVRRQPIVTCEKQFSFNCKYRMCVRWNQFKDLLSVLLA